MVFQKITLAKCIFIVYDIWMSHENKEGRMKMIEDTIKRINELARKSKAEGLTPEELQEQQILRREYIEAFKRNMRGTLNNISIKEADGSITHLGEKYGSKYNN